MTEPAAELAIHLAQLLRARGLIEAAAGGLRHRAKRAGVGSDRDALLETPRQRHLDNGIARPERDRADGHP